MTRIVSGEDEFYKFVLALAGKASAQGGGPERILGIAKGIVRNDFPSNIPTTDQATPHKDHLHPKHLEPVAYVRAVRKLLSFPPELAAILISEGLPEAARQLYPRCMQDAVRADLYWAVERVRALVPDLREKGAAVYAIAICLGGDLRQVRNSWVTTGSPTPFVIPFRAGVGLPAQRDELERFIKNGVVPPPPDPMIVDCGDGWYKIVRDETLRELVLQKLRALNPVIAELITSPELG